MLHSVIRSSMAREILKRIRQDSRHYTWILGSEPKRLDQMKSRCRELSKRSKCFTGCLEVGMSTRWATPVVDDRH